MTFVYLLCNFFKNCLYEKVNYKIEYINSKNCHNIIVFYYFTSANKAFVFSNVNLNQHLEIASEIEI